MAFKGIKEFEENLKKLSSRTTQELKDTLEVAANNVVTQAKGEHIFFKSLDPATVAAHPDRRFYTRTAKLVNSMRIGKTTEFAGGIQTEVLVGGISVRGIDGVTGYVNYAPFVEEEYPFLEPALKSTAQTNLNLIAKTVKDLLQ